MSLDWDITNINNCDQLCWHKTGKKDEDGDDERTLNPVTDALIWLTMIVDMPLSKAKDAEEFYTRVRMHESSQGCLLRQRQEYWAVSDGAKFDIHSDKADAVKAAAKVGALAQILEGERTVDLPITWQDVLDHVGLKTNVYGESKAKYKNKMARSLREKAERSLRYAKEKIEDEKTNIDKLGEAVHDGMDQ